ncbi:MAG: ExbD/TolR family protein [Puniceicoccaceae bacterium]
MRFETEDEENAELNMAPLIDAVFLLLIFFLVATMLKKEDKTVEEIDLPVSQSSLELAPDESVLMLGVDDEGGIYYEGGDTTIQILRDRLGEVARTEPDRRIRIDVDEEAPSHRVVELLDQLQFIGLRNVGVRTFHERYD